MTIPHPSPAPAGYALDLSVSTLGLLLISAAGLFFMARTCKKLLRERSWKAVRVPLLTGAALLVLTLTLTLASGRGSLLTGSFYLFFCLITFGLFLLWQFLRKIAGSILLLTAIGLVLAVVLFIRSLAAFTGDTRIATVTVLSVGTNGISLQLEKAGPSGPEVPTLLRLKGERFGPIVYQAIFSDTAVFLGTKTRYAWLGMTAFDGTLRQSDLHLFPDSLKRMSVFSAMERREVRLPFIRSVQLSMDSKIAVAGSVYDIRVKNNGGILIEPRDK